MGSNADHSVLDSDCPVGRRSYLARLFSNQSRDLARTAVTTIGVPRVGVPTEPRGRSGPRGRRCVASLPSTKLECFKCAAARRDNSCVSGVCRINSGPSLAARPRRCQAAGAAGRRVRRRCRRRGACLKSGRGWLATQSMVLLEPLSRENARGVRGQGELADARIHLRLWGILISRDAIGEVQQPGTRGSCVKYPPSGPMPWPAVSSPDREPCLPGGLSPGLGASPLVLAQDHLYSAME